MKHIFKIGDGMTIENSTAEERKEIMKLIFEKGYPTIRNEFDYIDFEFSDCVLFMENGFGTSKKVTTPLTYTQMKALILGDTSKMPFKAACEAIKHGTHQIEKDCDNLDLLRDVLKEAFPEDTDRNVTGTNFKAWDKINSEKFMSRTYPFDFLPIIKLSEIMTKEENVGFDFLMEMSKLNEKIDRQKKRIDKIVKVADSMVKKLNEQKELISQRDCVGRELKITPIEGVFQHVGNPVEEKPVELFSDRWTEIFPTLTRKEAEEKLSVKIVD